MPVSYAEKLRDPKWQKKRLLVLERDEFTCQKCGCTEDELHVHHKTYIFGNEPWEYEDENFITLCASCHRIEEYFKKDFSQLIKQLLLIGYTYLDFYSVLGQLKFPVEGISLKDRIECTSTCASSDVILKDIKQYLEEKNKSN